MLIQVEERARRQDAERRRRREQRMAERMQQTQPTQDLQTKPGKVRVGGNGASSEDATNIKITSGGRILETIEKLEEKVMGSNESSETTILEDKASAEGTEKC